MADKFTEFADRLFQLGGFMTQTGKVITVSFGTLQEANQFHNALVELSRHKSQIETCPICAEPLLDDDICATDIEMGICHAACLEGSPTVDLDTGEERDGPIDTYRYGDTDPVPTGTSVTAESRPSDASTAKGQADGD